MFTVLNIRQFRRLIVLVLVVLAAVLLGWVIYEQFGRRGEAVATIRGGPLRPQIRGTVTFTSVPDGTMVCVEVSGLPPYRPGRGEQDPVGPHGFHIHQVGSCEVGDPDEPFQAAGGHWDPDNQPHGNHAGDFPVLFSNDGKARMCFFTNRFKPEDVAGKAVIIHENPDDYRSQPAGDAGRRLACGVIKRVPGFWALIGDWLVTLLGR